MRRLTLVVVVLLALCVSVATWAAATLCNVNNTGSSAITIEIRSGKAQNCIDNDVVFTGQLAARSSMTTSYGGNVSKVCVRKQSGSGWSSNWAIAHCPSDDNKNCNVNLQ